MESNLNYILKYASADVDNPNHPAHYMINELGAESPLSASRELASAETCALERLKKEEEFNERKKRLTRQAITSSVCRTVLGIAEKLYVHGSDLPETCFEKAERFLVALRQYELKVGSAYDLIQAEKEEETKPVN